MKNKSIVLVIPLHFELYKDLILSLQKAGLDVIFLFITDKPFKYRDFAEHFKSFVYKNFLGQKNFKKQLIFHHENENLISQLDKIEQRVDYALIIRSDLLSVDTLMHIKSKVDKMIAYQWDGLNRFPSVFDRISIFDKFYVFDHNDYQNYSPAYDNLLLTTNFYLEVPKTENVVVRPKSICFVGSYLENRMPYIQELTDFLKQENFEIDIKLLCSQDKVAEMYEDSGIEFISNPLTYSEMLRHVQRYEVILDFDNSVIHQGLSFRIFEALFYNKKIITNNALVKKYDFYHPNNVFIWESENLHRLGLFLNEPMVNIDLKIIEKYSFNNWIKKILA
ncbi:hypothetical protein [Sphingobacterium paludis]|uniref:hypothetical protein n=1 Tax=Sphingobacterium paludis TaxID=1476465 RepID=UPI00105B8B38|nr:hypothetical protein [Sphingobacterium paludis]